jgi:DNA-binding NtrC family response regulator
MGTVRATHPIASEAEAPRPAASTRSGLDILLVDDDPDLRSLTALYLRGAGHRVVPAGDGAEATALLGTRVFDLMISDIRMPRGDGRTLLSRARADAPTTDVILMTAFGAVADAVWALQQGARDYLTKPFRAEELLARVERIAAEREIRRELAHAQAQLQSEPPQSPIIGRSPSIERLLERIDTIAQSDAPILITGESGVGKELVARTVHARSQRNNQTFVAVNCAAFPESLLEAELFGHDRGAFTGAVKKRDGRFKMADGGTLLLDEIAEIPLPAQAKLLRVLQEGTIEPLGTNDAISVDVRIISATHRNLRELIAAGAFREDLYYRLNVLDVTIPALRERRGDLPLLIQHYLRRFAADGQPAPVMSPRAFAALCEYRFPGNVRELAHAIEHAVVLARGGEIDLEHLPADITGAEPAGSPTLDQPRPLALATKEFEREYLARTLTFTGGKRARAAALLGISRKTLWEKLRAHGLHGARDED